MRWMVGGGVSLREMQDANPTEHLHGETTNERPKWL